MKKALVILLTLALAGGVFAQTVNVGGFWEGGVAILNNTGWDEPMFGAVAPNAWVGDGVRGELRIGGTNADGNAGFTFWLRASNNPLAGIFYRQAFGWVRLFDNLVELRGGRIHDDRLAAQDFLAFHWVTNYHGLVAYITPTDTIRIGVGAYSPNQWEDWEGAGLALWGGLGVEFGLGEFRTTWRINHAQAGDNSTDGIFSLRLRAIDNIPIDASVRLMNVNDFGDAGRIDVQGQVGINLVQDFAITAAAAFSQSQNDAHDDPYMAFGGWIVYNGLGNVVPRLDLFFVSGGEYNYATGGHASGSVLDYPTATFNGDQSYFSIRPQVQFRATANAWWEIGAIFNIELGDVSAARGTDDDPFTFGFFTGVRVLFP
jgi:hypothetical protein